MGEEGYLLAEGEYYVVDAFHHVRMLSILQFLGKIWLPGEA
jgi:hypothetical protein